MLLDLDFDVSVDQLAPVEVPTDTFRRLQQFVWHEARLLDERRWDEWLALWTDDGMYWVPQQHDQASPYDHISLSWEDKMMREVRVRRIENARNWSQQPPTHATRLVGNLSVDGVDAGGNLVLRAVFQMTEWRRKKTRQLAGHCFYKLVAEGEGWRLRMKRVHLVDCDAAHENLEIFL
ncbi:MAG TPA: aromatic-ring-hydroxylating dioxygenase subunit beta [Variovorax sp.]|nr:aromatic-ring-hydroxylating dioxygenase subunit beta [Variovorax sp.]